MQVVQIHIYYLSGLVEFSKKLKNSLLSYYDNKERLSVCKDGLHKSTFAMACAP
jgi:hypothetical protein